jgi:hypothetical protein
VADTPEFCPKCNADLKGEPIPEQYRSMYGGKTHYSRTIGLYDRGLDRTTHWLCPDCKGRWERV